MCVNKEGISIPNTHNYYYKHSPSTSNTHTDKYIYKGQLKNSKADQDTPMEYFVSSSLLFDISNLAIIGAFITAQ